MLGLACVIAGKPGSTVNTFVAETISAPVVTVRFRMPKAALDATVNWTVKVVGFVTVTVFTAIPAPRLTVVVP